jgi:FkbM family methyltransferase
MLIPMHDLVRRFPSMNIKGILHIGAHECEELKDYQAVGVNAFNTYWVEAMPDKVAFCKGKYGDGLHIYQAVIDETDGADVTFNITNNGQSSSILELGTHAFKHPHVHVINKVVTKTIRLDTLIEREQIPISELNFVNLDIQGVELRALKSMEKYLQHVQYIYTEVNIEEVYKGCNLIGEIDDYLRGFGFERVAQYIYNQYGWGDAFYMKK